jgi:hypothetical protein
MWKPAMEGLGRLSGVPLRAFIDEFRNRIGWVVAGLLLVVPVFMTGFDGTRWIVVSFDVAIVYLACAARRTEIEQPPSPKSLRLFACLVVVLALIPIGTVPGFGGPRMI